ncbi:SDR family oxidoreductase [Flavobacterium laiguense]|uniref:Short-chain dehydrogenase n=1 Tax=Flavobacterium laiguense TaxID=2169409 RepID=A0A2U1JP00_9FLAO|nr:SDR family oxidoreductase [Flavobacterium laiguense]PWA06725.1 short-chain dehydrogenase [Flavobacterium laiguense]
MSNKLKGKIAVITGGNSGIGYATAKELVAEGATVVITGRNEVAVKKTAAELNVIGIVSDQSHLVAIDQLVKQVESTVGKVDILFINAGIAAFIPIESVTEDHFDSIMNINFKGAFFTLQKFIPILNEGAAVTFLSSLNATTGMANSSVYAASKASLNSLVRAASIELADRQIRVNSVSPGPINTPIFGKLGLDEESVNGLAQTMQNAIPLKRFGTVEQVAKIVAFLSSDDAAYTTGSDYPIDGGLGVNAVV